MSKRKLGWLTVAVCVLLGAHLAWEQNRYSLETPKGTIQVGMTLEEVEAILGPWPYRRPWVQGTLARWSFRPWGVVAVWCDNGGRVLRASLRPPDQAPMNIPRPSFVEYIRSRLPGGNPCF
jgi:hypothetical protein